VLLLKFMVKQY